LFLAIALAFVVLGCGHVYRAIGVSTETAEQLARDDAKKIEPVVRHVRDMFWESVYAALAILGGGVSGWLGLKTHRANKVNKAVILGVEHATGDNIKESIQHEAVLLGVADKLHKCVKGLTPGKV